MQSLAFVQVAVISFLFGGGGGGGGTMEGLGGTTAMKVMSKLLTLLLCASITKLMWLSFR